MPLTDTHLGTHQQPTETHTDHAIRLSS